jgi:hypothetical protein
MRKPAFETLIDWYFAIPKPARYIGGVALLVAALLLFRFDGTLGGLLFGVGLAMLVFAGPDDSENNGYHF